MLYFIKETYGELLSFLKKPVDEQYLERSKAFKIKKLVTFFVFDITLSLLCIAVFKVILSTGLISEKQNKLYYTISEYPSLILILFGVILVPLLEEFVFRYYLRFRKSNLPVYLILVLLFSLKFYSSYGIVLIILLLLILIAYFLWKSHFDDYIRNIWMTKFKYIFYFSAFLFALIHLTNYKITIYILLFFPFLIAAQFILGLFNGYLRVKFGLIWGFFLHALHNLIFFIPAILIMSGSSPKMNINNNMYSLKIEQSGKLNKNISSFTTNQDSIIIKKYTLKSIISYFTNKEIQLINFDENINEEKRLDIRFVNHKSKYVKAETTILRNLEQYYKIRIGKKMILTEVWELNIVDSIKLKSRVVSKSSGSYGCSSLTGQEGWLYYGVNLENFVSMLNTSCIYSECIILNSQIKLNDVYTFRISGSDIDALKKSLPGNGLELKKVKKQIEHIIVTSTDKKNNEFF